MVTQLDNVLEPLLEQSRRAIGFAPSVDICYVGKNNVAVRLDGHGKRIQFTCSSSLEGIEKQFAKFISEVLSTTRREIYQRPEMRLNWDDIVDFDGPVRAVGEPIEINWREYGGYSNV